MNINLTDRVNKILKTLDAELSESNIFLSFDISYKQKQHDILRKPINMTEKKIIDVPDLEKLKNVDTYEKNGNSRNMTYIYSFNIKKNYTFENIENNYYISPNKDGDMNMWIGTYSGDNINNLFMNKISDDFGEYHSLIEKWSLDKEIYFNPTLKEFKNICKQFDVFAISNNSNVISLAFIFFSCRGSNRTYSSTLLFNVSDPSIKHENIFDIVVFKSKEYGCHFTSIVTNKKYKQDIVNNKNLKTISEHRYSLVFRNEIINSEKTNLMIFY